MSTYVGIRSYYCDKSRDSTVHVASLMNGARTDASTSTWRWRSYGDPPTPTKVVAQKIHRQ